MVVGGSGVLAGDAVGGVSVSAAVSECVCVCVGCSVVIGGELRQVIGGELMG